MKIGYFDTVIQKIKGGRFWGHGVETVIPVDVSTDRGHVDSVEYFAGRQRRQRRRRR